MIHMRHVFKNSVAMLKGPVKHLLGTAPHSVPCTQGPRDTPLVLDGGLLKRKGLENRSTCS